MMPKSRKGLPVNGTTAKEGSEKPSALNGNVPSNCLMESMSTVQGSYEIDLQGVPNQGLVSEVNLFLFCQGNGREACE